MPSFAALRERGRRVPLVTPGSTFVAASFPSLWTGREVEEHALYYPFVWAPDAQRVILSAKGSAPTSIWETVAAAGHSVLVVDPYEGRPPTQTVRTCLSGVQFRNRVVLDRWDSPPGSLRAWEKRLGRAPAANEVFGQQDLRLLVRFAERLRGVSARAAEVIEGSLSTEVPELLIAMLPAVHLAGHQLWDPASVLPAGTSVPRILQTALRDVYVSADEALGRILAALPTDADVIVFSVLGMSVNTSRNDLLPEMLGAVLDGDRAEADSGSAWRLRARVPTRLRARIADALPNRLAVELAARAELRGMAWDRTRAFCVPSDTHGHVQLNRRGRERDGIVSPDECGALLDEIVRGLSTFVERDGVPVIEAVERTQDVVPTGPRSHLLPDLLVRWRRTPAASMDLVTSPEFGVVRRRGAGTGRSGNHTDEAWAIVAPARGCLRETVGRPYRVTDLSATALAASGIETHGEPLLEWGV